MQLYSVWKTRRKGRRRYPGDDRGGVYRCAQKMSAKSIRNPGVHSYAAAVYMPNTAARTRVLRTRGVHGKPSPRVRFPRISTSAHVALRRTVSRDRPGRLSAHQKSRRFCGVCSSVPTTPYGGDARSRVLGIGVAIYLFFFGGAGETRTD